MADWRGSDGTIKQTANVSCQFVRSSLLVLRRSSTLGLSAALALVGVPYAKPLPQGSQAYRLCVNRTDASEFPLELGLA